MDNIGQRLCDYQIIEVCYMEQWGARLKGFLAANEEGFWKLSASLKVGRDDT